MQRLIKLTCGIIGITRPFRIEIRQNLGKGKIRGEYSEAHRKGKFVYHQIRVSLNIDHDLRTFDELLVHEFIHAGQSELGLTEYHGPYFAIMANTLKIELGLLGYTLPNIYIPGTDIEPADKKK